MAKKKQAAQQAPKSALAGEADGNQIDLSLKRLETVPVRDLELLPTVTIVDLSQNGLPALPLDFGRLNHLFQLDLSKNKLTELPESFGELTSLRKLDLFGNQLQRLPLSMENLTDLGWLDINDNPWHIDFLPTRIPCSSETECKACAKQVLARITDLADRRRVAEQKRLALEEKRAAEEEARRRAEKEAAKKEKAALRLRKSKSSSKDTEDGAEAERRRLADMAEAKAEAAAEKAANEAMSGPSPLVWLLRLVVIVLLLFAMAVGLAHVVDLGEYGQYLLDFVGALSGAATWW